MSYDKKQLNKTNLLKMMELQYGTMGVIRYLTKNAKDAAARAKVDITSNNPSSLAANTQTMIENIETLMSFISEEKDI